MRALASHQCGPGSNPGVDAICGLSLLLVLSLAPRGFSPGTPVFPSPQKPTFPNSNSTRNQVDEEPLCGCATSKSLFIYLFVRPLLGYTTQIWAPQPIELIVKLEDVQRCVTKFIAKLPYSSNISYVLFTNCKPNTYLFWHELLDATFFFKLTHGLVNVNSSVLPEVRKYGRRTRSSTSNVNKYIINKCKTSTYQKSFLIRTSRIWNCLVDELDLSSSTLASFKLVIFIYFKSALAVSYDCEDPCSFKPTCLKCNSARRLSFPITCCM